jgi:hypothetical protein|tara:strand:- start:9937 stop:10287 length:351 start_codon:yes stop_codon:yes gene_type:complete
MPRKHPEQDLQRVCADWLQILENQGKLAFFHPPNGGWRSKVEAAIFTSLGVKPGVSDLCILMPGGRVGFIELKARAETPTDKQLDFMEKCQLLGIPTAVCWKFEQVEDVVRGWLES